jgi:hypothetical protein
VRFDAAVVVLMATEHSQFAVCFVMETEFRKGAFGLDLCVGHACMVTIVAMTPAGDVLGHVPYLDAIALCTELWTPVRALVMTTDHEAVSAFAQRQPL